MPDPATREEYDALFLANTYTAGFGLENVRQVLACPFCAAPDWATWYIAEMAISDYAAMREEHVCGECGRGGKMLITRPLDGEVRSEFVQTRGADAPDYLVPTPRRVG